MTSSSSSDLLLILGISLGIAGGISSIFLKHIRLERRIYWTSWLVASSLISASVLDRGWRPVAVAMAACVGVAFLYAYLRTTYVKIGGRVYTYTLFRNRPDPPLDGSTPPPLPVPPVDAYGNVLTAPKLWWTITAFSVAAGVLATSQGRTAVTIGGGAVVVVLLALVGYVDAREGFPICRGQHVQLALTAIVSIPLFLLPPLAYAATYWGAGGRHHSAHR